MKVVISEKEKLKDLSSLCFAAVNPKSPLPMLSMVEMQTEGDHLLIRGTDLDVEVRVRIPAEVSEGGRAIVREDSFKGILDRAEYETISIESDEEELRIETGRSRFSLRVQGKEFPEPMEFEKTSFCVVDGEKIRSAIAKTEFSVSTERTRYALNGILVNAAGGTFRMVSTDGRRLSMVQTEVAESEGESSGLIVPLKALRICKVLARTQPGEIRVEFSDSHVAFDSADVRVVSRTVDGQFPDYDAVIPRNCSKTVVADRDLLEQSVVEGSLLGDREARAIVVDLKPGSMTLSSRSMEGEQALRTMDVDYDGPDFRISFNPNYLLDPVRAMNTERVRLCFKEKDSAALLLSEDEPQDRYVVMPLTLE